MKEHEVLARFPFGVSMVNAEIRRALFRVVWAFENVEGQDGIIGPTFAVIVRDGLENVTALECFADDLLMAEAVFREGASKLRAAAETVNKILLERTP
jgi:hypothetical protein